jgi:ribonuclease Z
MKGEVPHSNWSIRCISTPGPDTDLAVYVSFEKARFLFGCGQGTQRAFVQKRLSMRGLGAVFLPGGTEEGRGGVAGMSVHEDSVQG